MTKPPLRGDRALDATTCLLQLLQVNKTLATTMSP